jgi:hypothetical protein
MLLTVSQINKHNGITYEFLTVLNNLFQAAYNVGGHSVNSQIIQNSILGCQSHRPSLVWHSSIQQSAVKIQNKGKKSHHNH